MDKTDEVRNVKNKSILDEIKAQDIYTINSSNIYPTLPLGFGEALVDRESLLKKSNLKCRSIMKKLSVQEMKRSLLNLPALAEEDTSYFPSVPVCNLDLSQFNTIDNSKALSDDDGVDVDELPKTPSMVEDDESWVDLSKHTQSSPSHSGSKEESTMPFTPTSPDRVTPPPFGNGEEYLRLLREAQKESNQSSARVSLASSRRDTPRDSPKSPPNSPNTELTVEKEDSPFRGVFINYYNREGDFVRVEKNVETDWIWDWSSRPDQSPPKEWRFIHPKSKVRRGASIRRLMVGNSSLFSRDVLYTVFITNVLSLLLGTGIGIWLSKKSGGGSTVATISPVHLN